jgi:hypothetical protein
MKLKINKTLTKMSRIQIRNQKNKDWIEKKNTWQIIIEELNSKQTKFL